MKAIAELLGGVAMGVLPWRWILGGVAAVGVLGLWLYVSHLQDKNDRLAVDLAGAIQTNNENVEVLNRLAAHNARVVQALTLERDALSQRLRVVSNIRSEIDHAPQSDDGPVAPVLSRVLERLRLAQGGDADPGRAPGRADGAVVVPGSARSADR